LAAVRHGKGPLLIIAGAGLNLLILLLTSSHKGCHRDSHYTTVGFLKTKKEILKQVEKVN